MQGASIGQVEHGEIFYFSISNRNDEGTIIPNLDPQFYDVIDNETGSPLLADVYLNNETDRDLWHGAIDTSSGEFEAGRTYGLIIKEFPVEAPPLLLHYNFTVTHPVGSKLDWLRNDIENVLFPRFKRLLALSGENLAIDNFTYDSAGNITGLRIRAFENRADAVNATPDITDNEPGELATYDVVQSHDAPRNVRTWHLSTPETEPVDSPATDNQQTDAVNAPGNAGDYPI